MAGTYNFIVRVMDSGTPPPQVDTQALTIVISPGSSLNILPASLPTVTAGAPFSIQLSVTGGVSPYFLELTFQPNPPPPWLNLSSSGLLTGTPPSAGSYSFSLFAMDSMSSSVEKTNTLNVGAPVVLVPTTLPNATAVSLIRSISPLLADSRPIPMAWFRDTAIRPQPEFLGSAFRHARVALLCLVCRPGHR